MRRSVFIAGALAAPVAASLPPPTVATIAKRPGAVVCVGYGAQFPSTVTGMHVVGDWFYVLTRDGVYRTRDGPPWNFELISDAIQRADELPAVRPD